MTSLDRRKLLLGVLGIAGAAALSGCQDGEPSAAPTTAAPTPIPTLTPAPAPTISADTRPRWPLTGQLLKDPTDAHHAAVAVKVPDNQDEHPQSGLDRADIVYVELDGYRDASGYSGTRLVPIFHSHLADDVAAVRSIRPVDIAMLSPINALIGNTGATHWVVEYVKHYGQHVDGMLSYLATKGTGSYSIDPKRVRTYHGVTYYDRAVVCHPKILAKQTKKFRDGPPQPYFPWASTDNEVSTASGKQATHIRVPWKQGDSYDMGYQYDKKSGKYLRSMPWGPHVLTDGKRVAPDNVLVIRAETRYGKIYPGPGAVEPIHEIIDAQGTFYYFHGGRYVAGTWTKGAVNEVFKFTRDDGSPLKMAPGQTYVELPKANAKIRIKA
jgi:hypothetical protein